MPNFNVVFHGMILFAEDDRYCDILFPEIKEHDYRFGDPSNGSFPQDLAPGDYEIAGIPPRARPDRFSKHADKYLVLRASDIRDRKSTRLNSSHRCISYAVFCLKK